MSYRAAWKPHMERARAMRANLKSQEYWQASIKDREDFTQELRSEIAKTEETYAARINDAAFLEHAAFNLVSARYSAGDPIVDCVVQARSLLLEVYPLYVSTCALAPRKGKADEAGGWDFRTRYLALAVLCRLTPNEACPLVEALDFWPERDAVWERFVALLGLGERRPPVTTLVWADPYAPLLEALDPEVSDFERMAALHAFNKSWLKEMRKGTNPRYSDHDNKHNTYVGYWNFEAAAAAVAMGIDDSLLEGSKTYPKDWADWAKA